MSAPPVILLHGFMGTPATFDGVRDRLAERLGAEVIGLLLPTPGPTPSGSAGGSLSAHHNLVAKAVLAELDDLGVDAFDIVGYSLGGRIAMHVSRLVPNRVQRLVLEAAHPGLISPEERQHRIEHDLAWAERIRSEWPRVLDDWYGQGVFASARETGLTNAMALEKRDGDAKSHATTLEQLSLGHQAPMWDFLAQMSCPGLFVSGEMDARYRAIGERLASLSGPMRHVNVKGAGHVVHREQPDAYLSTLESFLKR